MSGQRPQDHLARAIRGQILNALYALQVSGGGLTDSALLASLKNIHPISESELLVHLRYLAAKGYVRLTEIEAVIGLAPQRVELTPRGIDLLEKSIPADPGIINPL